MARLAAVTSALALAAAGCGSDRATRGEGTLRVVATMTPVADIAANAGGRRVEVTALVPRGADPHRWRPAARHVDAIREADLVVLAGGPIDDWARAAGAERELALLPLLEPLAGDSHWWLDPVRVVEAAKEVRNEFARADVDGAGYYEAATADYLARLRDLHEDIRDCLRRLEPGHPPLAVRHDGLAYFEARYGLRADARGRGARPSEPLWVDTLAPAGADADSYLGAMAENTEAIVETLSGGEETCRPLP